MKRCTQCAVEKPSSEFYVRKAECKACSIARTRQWQKAHPDRARANKRTPAARAAGRRAYARKAQDADFRERARLSVAAWRAKNREKHRAYSKAWVEKNRERYREYQREQARWRRLGKDNLSHAYGAILRADPCSYCGAVVAGQIDHVVPVIAGGTNEWENLTAACINCNSQKSAQPMLLWMLTRSG